jgi:hypothetical protein
MKKFNITSLSFILLLFLSSFGFVEYSVIKPKFNISTTDTTKSIQNRQELVSAKNLGQGQSNDQNTNKDESTESAVVSWAQYFALALKTIFLKLVSIFISFFIM